MFLSIIIPSYNMAQYLPRCLESVARQNLEDFEAIVVNDGSTDNTREVLDDIITNERIPNVKQWLRVVHKENGGACSARNKAIDISQGVYITELDADDELIDGGLRLLIEAAKSQQALPDVVMAGLDVIAEDGSKMEAMLPVELTYYGDDAARVMCSNISEPIWKCVVSKLYKRSIIENNALCFDVEMNKFEDTEFVYRFMMNIRSLISIPVATYRYLQQDNSSMSKFKGQNQIDSLEKLNRRRMEFINAIYSDKSERDIQLEDQRRIISFDYLSTIYVLYRTKIPHRYYWLKQICKSAKTFDAGWARHFRIGNPRIIRASMRPGLWATHLLMSMVSMIPALRNKLRG